MERVRLHPECIQCQLRRQLTAYPPTASREEKTLYMQRLLRLLAEAPVSTGAPVLSREVKRLKAEMFGIQEDFSKEKQYYNDLMLRREAELMQAVRSAEDPLYAALQYSLTGNYIDFGGSIVNVNVDDLNRLLAASPQIALDAEAYAHLRRELSNARSMVFLTDNCGEVVLDKLLLRILRETYPRLQLTIIVRGGDVLNDVNLQDAQQVGLMEFGSVIDNGNDVAGTWLEAVSEQALSTMQNADLLLAKGQANFETLNGCGMNLFYLFMCKCDMFAARFNVPKLTGMLIHDSRV